MTEQDPTSWFEPFYRSAERGETRLPWDTNSPHFLLVEWAEMHRLDGTGRRALVVGAGLGDDAEYLAGRGFDTTAFDIAPTAIRGARERFPESRVDYGTADLLDPPPEWTGAFDFVLESLTVQSMPIAVHERASRNVAGFVAPDGTLLVIATARDDAEPEPDGPPWPLLRREVEGFAAAGELERVEIERIPDEREPRDLRWRAELRRRPGARPS